jgi:hypothetical protein
MTLMVGAAFPTVPGIQRGIEDGTAPNIELSRASKPERRSPDTEPRPREASPVDEARLSSRPAVQGLSYSPSGRTQMLRNCTGSPWSCNPMGPDVGVLAS